MRGRQHLSCRWSRLPSPQWWLSASPITWVMSAALGSNSSSICRLPAPFDAAAPGDEDLVRRCSRAGCYSVDTSKTGHEFSCWDSCNSYVPPHESLSIAICPSSPLPPLHLSLSAWERTRRSSAWCVPARCSLVRLSPHHNTPGKLNRLHAALHSPLPPSLPLCDGLPPRRHSIFSTLLDS